MLSERLAAPSRPVLSRSAPSCLACPRPRGPSMTVAPPPGAAPRGLLIDYGGVLTTDIFEAFHIFERRAGLERSAVGRLLRDSPQARSVLVALETGAASEAEFESGIGPLLGV